MTGAGDDPPWPDAPSRGAGRRPRRRWPTWAVVALNVVVALVVVSLVQAFVLRVHNVSSSSMVSTLQVRDRILSSPIPYVSSGPDRGDIVIFGHGATWQADRLERASNPLLAAVLTFGDLTGIGPSNRIYTVKRVIGVPGDTVACCDAGGRLLVNGTVIDEPYIHEDLPFTRGGLDCSSTPRSARCFGPLTVPDDRYLVMGDNRAHSADSVISCRREDAGPDCARWVRREAIVGQVIAKAWPPGGVR